VKSTEYYLVISLTHDLNGVADDPQLSAQNSEFSVLTREAPFLEIRNDKIYYLISVEAGRHTYHSRHKLFGHLKVRKT